MRRTTLASRLRFLRGLLVAVAAGFTASSPAGAATAYRLVDVGAAGAVLSAVSVLPRARRAP